MTCHQADLTGVEPEEGIPAPSLTDDAWEKQWNGKPLKGLADRIKAIMPADDPGTLTDAQVYDVMAQILKRKNAPAGSTELSAATIGDVTYRTSK